MTDYKSFTIDNLFRIYKEGKQVFTSHWQRCASLEEAKLMIDMSELAKPVVTGKMKSIDLDNIFLTESQEVDPTEIMDKESQRLQDYYDIELEKHWA